MVCPLVQQAVGASKGKDQSAFGIQFRPFPLFAPSCDIRKLCRCMLHIVENGEEMAAFCHAALIAQLLVLIPFHEELTYGAYHHAPSFREFYASDQFKQIKRFIGRPTDSYRVASIGLHPAIAQYNGFYTLDTYANIYPLKYKYQFRKIIAKELDKNPALKRYFDEWGRAATCLLTSLENITRSKRARKKKITNLELNTEAFKKMGGQYIFSSVPIMNAEQNKLRLFKAVQPPAVRLEHLCI